MADRSSAYLFGCIFDLIDECVPEPKRTEEALRFWKMSREYDFSDSQMESDEVLTRLGLAQKGVDPHYPEDGETTIYYGERGWRSPTSGVADKGKSGHQEEP